MFFAHNIFYLIWSTLFFALLCASAQQTYCRHAAGRRRPSSIDIIFSDTAEWINANFLGQVLIHHISTFFCRNVLNFWFFFYEFISFSLIWDHTREKKSNDISESTQQIHSKKSYIFLGRVYQSCSKNCEISNFEFLTFFSFSLTWGHMGVKISNDMLLWKYAPDLFPKIYLYSWVWYLPKLLKVEIWIFWHFFFVLFWAV